MLRKEFLRGNKKIKKSRPAPRPRGSSSRTTAAVIKARQCKKGAQKTDGRRTTALLKTILGVKERGHRPPFSLSPLLLHAGNRYSPLSLLDIAPRIINAIVSLIRGVNASGRELRTRISRRDTRGLRQIPLHNSVAHYLYSLEFAPDVFS